MKTKTITMLLITVMMVVAAQFNTICAQSTKNYTFTFNNLKVSKALGEEAIEVKGKATVVITDKKGAAPTVTVKFGKTNQVFKVAETFGIESYDDKSFSILFNELVKTGRGHTYNISFSDQGEEGKTVSFMRAEWIDGYEYWSLYDFRLTDQTDIKTFNAVKDLYNDLKANKTKGIKYDKDFYL